MQHVTFVIRDRKGHLVTTALQPVVTCAVSFVAREYTQSQTNLECARNRCAFTETNVFIFEEYFHRIELKPTMY